MANFKALIPGKGWNYKVFIIRQNKFVFVKMVKYKWNPFRPWDSTWLTFDRHIKRKPVKHFDGTKNSFVKEWMDITPVWVKGKAAFATKYFTQYVTEEYPNQFDEEYVMKVELFDLLSIEEQNNLILEFANKAFGNLHIFSNWARVDEYDVE